jgi:hypothetical protein
VALLIALTLLGSAGVVIWLGAQERLHLVISLVFITAISWWWGAEFLSHHRLRIHTWEVFHHYLHTKYLPELRYRRMYQCVAEAAGEDRRDIRDLVDNRYRSVSEIQARDGLCRKHYTPGRWESFENDVRWFRAEIGPERWAKVYFDHGANASPTWAAVARLLVAGTSASEGVVWRAAALDTILLAILWVIVWLSFGPIAATVTGVLWSTCILGGYTWTGGAFLRKDWLIAFALSITTLRHGWFFTAGLLAGYAGMVRIFPLAIVAGAVAVQWVVSASDRRSLVRCAAGMVIAVGVGWVIPSLLFDIGIWEEFFLNLAKHRATNAGNVVGVPQILENVFLCRYGPYGSSAGSCELPEQRPFETVDLIIAGFRFIAVAMAVAVAALRFRSDSVWLKALVLLGALPLCLDAASYDMEVMALLGLAACSVSSAASGVLLVGWAIMNVSAVVLKAAPGNTMWTVLGAELVLTLALWFVYAERRSDKSVFGARSF